MFKNTFQKILAISIIGMTAISVAFGRQIASLQNQINMQIEVIRDPIRAYRWGQGFISSSDKKYIEPLLPILQLYTIVSGKLDIKIAKDDNYQDKICFYKECGENFLADEGKVVLKYRLIDSESLLDEAEVLFKENYKEIYEKYVLAETYFDKTTNGDNLTNDDVKSMLSLTSYIYDLLKSSFTEIPYSEEYVELEINLRIIKIRVMGLVLSVWTFEYLDIDYLLTQIETILGFSFDHLFDIISELSPEFYQCDFTNHCYNY